MVEETSAQNTGAAKPRSRKKFAAMLLAGVVVLAGGTVVSVTAANASAKETARLCTIALDEGAAATAAVRASTAATDKALDAVKSTKLPGGAGNSTAYEKRPADKAAKPRPSGAEFIDHVAQSRTALAGIAIPNECTSRAQVEEIQSATAKSRAATKTLDTNVGALVADHKVFQAAEVKRVIVEKKAAEKKAEVKRKADKKKAEAKRKAAEKKAEAKRIAAEKKAASSRKASVSDAPGQQRATPHRYTPRKNVQQPRKYVPRKTTQSPQQYTPRKVAPQPKRQSTPSYEGSTKKSSGGSGSGGYKGSSGTKGGGGGGVVSTKPNGACWTSNGMGGTKRCGT